jgi:hypothetical protein
MAGLVSEDIFRELTGTYTSFSEMESRLLQIFNSRVGAIPPNYSYRQLIELAEQRGWVVKSGREFRVSVNR